MFGQFLISFREALEAALITSIILAYLARSGKRQYIIYIWIGVFTAIIASIILASFIWLIYGNLNETSIKLFEGIAALIAVIVLTSMILWMATRGKFLKSEIEQKIGKALTKGSIIGLMVLAFILVFREGLETTLFLIPFSTNDLSGTILGATIGISASIAIAFAIFSIGMRIDLQRLFFFSSIFLILLAGGLAGYGIHELIEYKEALGQEVGWFGSAAYDLGISSSSILHHKGAVGSVFAVMFGYSVTMEWGRILIHMIYIITFIPLTFWFYNKKNMNLSISIKRFLSKIRSMPIMNRLKRDYF